MEVRLLLPFPLLMPDLQSCCTEAYYKDFFDPPPRGKRSDRQKMELPGKVRFHEEVQFKKIKSGKKKKNLSTEDLLQSYDEASTTGGFVSYRSHDSGDPKDESDEAVEDDVSVSDASVMKSQEAISRLKDDLFADRDENENGTKFLHFIVMHARLPNLQNIYRHIRSGWQL